MKLAFYHGPRKGRFWKAVGWMVRNWTSGRYTHAEIIFSDGLWASSSMADNGVRFADRTKEPDFSPEHWDIVPAPFDEAPARQWFEANKGAEFDTWGLLAFMWRPFKGHPDKWFCSEACAEALGFPDSWRFCPNTLHAVIRNLSNSAGPHQ